MYDPPDLTAVPHSVGSTRPLVMSVSPEVYATVQVDVPLSRELGAGLHVHREAIERAAGKGD
ncbi:hypothetical protein AB0C12_38420 [Actinoplanes sp. NPDC048967]|uniref:hypothetical protein n=1 Tax=Actinoplanes sp. NPDC048967 TaxID=3155269 RepID=UPI0033FA35AF